MAIPDLRNLPYTPLVTYNGTTATGGDSVKQDLNVFYNVSPSFPTVVVRRQLQTVELPVQTTANHEQSVTEW